LLLRLVVEAPHILLAEEHARHVDPRGDADAIQHPVDECAHIDVGFHMHQLCPPQRTDDLLMGDGVAQLLHLKDP